MALPAVPLHRVDRLRQPAGRRPTALPIEGPAAGRCEGHVDEVLEAHAGQDTTWAPDAVQGRRSRTAEDVGIGDDVFGEVIWGSVFLEH